MIKIHGCTSVFPAPQLWSPEDCRRLEAMWADGLSITKIGTALGKSRNAVVGKAHRMGLQAREQDEALAKATEAARMSNTAGAKYVAWWRKEARVG